MDHQIAAQLLQQNYLGEQTELVFLNACYSELVGKALLEQPQTSKNLRIIAWEGLVPNSLCNKLAKAFYKEGFFISLKHHDVPIDMQRVKTEIETYCRLFPFEKVTCEFRGEFQGMTSTTYVPILLPTLEDDHSGMRTASSSASALASLSKPDDHTITRNYSAAANGSIQDWVEKLLLNTQLTEQDSRDLMGICKWFTSCLSIIDLAEPSFLSIESDLRLDFKMFFQKKINQLKEGKKDVEKLTYEEITNLTREELENVRGIRSNIARYHTDFNTIIKELQVLWNNKLNMSADSDSYRGYTTHGYATSVDELSRSHRWADSALRVLFSSPKSGEEGFRECETSIVAKFVFAIALENDSTVPEKGEMTGQTSDATFVGCVPRLDSIYPSVSRLLHPKCPPSMCPSVYPFLSAVSQTSLLVCEKTIASMEEYRAFVSLDSYKDLDNAHGARVRVQDVWCPSFRVQGTQEEADAVSTRVLSMLTLQFAVEVAGGKPLLAHEVLVLENALREVLCEELNIRVDLFGEDQIGLGHANVDGTLTLLARVRVSNVHMLQYLRDVVLIERKENEKDFSERIQHRMATMNHGTVKLNTGAFLESCERALYTFDRLTQEQGQVHAACAQALREQHNISDGRIPTVRIDGAAGTGKTFLALHDLLIQLRQDRTVLFVARNTALGFFAAGWAYRRLQLHMTRERAMAAMEHFWTLSLDEGEVKLRKCEITAQTSEMTFVFGSSDSMVDPKFALVVVDEAHHVYGYRDEDEKARDFCHFMEQCCQGCAARILFSDVSQSTEGTEDVAKKRFPPHELFNMDVVVRGTEWVVLGAMVCIPQRLPLEMSTEMCTLPCGFDTISHPLLLFLRLSRRYFSLR